MDLVSGSVVLWAEHLFMRVIYREKNMSYFCWKDQEITALTAAGEK